MLLLRNAYCTNEKGPRAWRAFQVLFLVLLSGLEPPTY
jgi:hypothetical protein